MTGLLRLLLLAGLVAAVVVATATAEPSRCTHGVSSVGPAVLIDGHLAGDRNGLTPHTEACLP